MEPDFLKKIIAGIAGFSAGYLLQRLFFFLQKNFQKFFTKFFFLSYPYKPVHCRSGCGKRAYVLTD